MVDSLDEAFSFIKEKFTNESRIHKLQMSRVKGFWMVNITVFNNTSMDIEEWELVPDGAQQVTWLKLS